MKVFRLLIGLSLLCTALYFWYEDYMRPLQTQLPLISEPPPGMVYVPGGKFQMGIDTSDGGDIYDGPSHAVAVDAFFIDIYEVTNEDYAKFINDSHHPPPSTWVGGVYPSSASHKPVTGVTWVDAQAYARWAGKRLPTEVEWEFAARGLRSFVYPWGNEWDKGAISEGASEGPADVGTNPHNKSPFGVFDMVGNVWEWTENDLRAYQGGTQLSTDHLKVIRGCMYKCDRNQMKAGYRRGWPQSGDYDYTNTGFRCAQDSRNQSYRRLGIVLL